jgi:hypothetical protein
MNFYTIHFYNNYFPVNVQKNVKRFERGSERRKSERRRVRTLKVSLIWSERRKSKRSERQKYFQNVENHFVEKNVESKQMLDFRRSEISWRHR